MTVTARNTLVLAVLIAGSVAGCGSDDADTNQGAIERTSPTSSPSTATVASDTTEVSVDEPATPTTEPGERTVLDGLSGELVLTRQRDLLDRGFINVQVTNDTGAPFTVTGRQLVPTHFDTEPAAPRTSTIPDGRRVNLQVPFGTTNDCTTNEPVTAQLDFTYLRNGTASTLGSLAIGGTELLDQIRADQCAQQDFDRAFVASFENASVTGEQIDVDLILTPTGTGEHGDTMIGSTGTILVDATVRARADAPITINGDEPTTVAVEFSVIRCDPHAMAEVTKRYGLELRLRTDTDNDVRTVDIDVDPLTDELDEIVANCRANTEATN